MDTVLSNPGCKWKKKTLETMEKYNISEWELAEDKAYIKGILKHWTSEKFKEKMNSNPENKHKIMYFLNGRGDWEPEKPANYMNKLTRKQASTIFKARTRMIKIKGNYRNGYNELS